MIRMQNVSKIYRTEHVETHALSGFSLHVESTENFGRYVAQPAEAERLHAGDFVVLLDAFLHLRAGVIRTFSQRNGNGLFSIIADNIKYDFIARMFVTDDRSDLVCILQRMAFYGDDDVIFLQSRQFSSAARYNPDNLCRTARDIHGLRQRLAIKLYASKAAAYRSTVNQLRGYIFHYIHRNGEANALITARARIDRRIYPDEPAAQINQRSP